MTTLYQNFDPKSTNAALGAALAYAARGWSVLPLTPRQKMPLAGSSGYKASTTDPAAILNVWSTRPDLNVGIAPSGLFLVIDVDPRNGGDRSLARLGCLPKTLTVETPSGGTHYYMSVPQGISLRKSLSSYPGIDFLFSRCYVVAPPSVHPNGGKYKWRDGCSPDDLEMAEATRSLLELLATTEPRPRCGESSDAPELDETASFESILAGCAFGRLCFFS